MRSTSQAASGVNSFGCKLLSFPLPRLERFLYQQQQFVTVLRSSVALQAPAPHCLLFERCKHVVIGILRRLTRNCSPNDSQVNSSQTMNQTSSVCAPDLCPAGNDFKDFTSFFE
mmetsp:Transcript_36973/g.83253  ORF Transcript_36973/g.83253 Transcript_36973/m.83253 type:complete len:114 (+) Transcript_36973:2893-3234(+)